MKKKKSTLTRLLLNINAHKIMKAYYKHVISTVKIISPRLTTKFTQMLDNGNSSKLSLTH